MNEVIKKLNKIKRNESGAISLFVILAMLFFLVFVLSSYMMISRRSQTQAESMAELKQLYKGDPNAEYDKVIGNQDSVIRITNTEDYFKMCNSNASNRQTIIVDGVSYDANENQYYVLDRDIEIDMSIINGFIPGKEDTDGSPYVFQDYRLYNNTKINKNGKEVYYLFDSDGDGIKERYILIAFNGISKSSNIYVGNNECNNRRFSIYSKINEYSTDKDHQFLLYKSTTDTFGTMWQGATYYTTSFIGENYSDYSKLEFFGPQNINSINVYFLFVKLDKNNSMIGSKLGDFASPGQYVDYELDYDNVTVNGKTSSKKGWRIFWNEKDEATGAYNILLISAGTPLKYTISENMEQDRKRLNFEDKNCLFETSEEDTFQLDGKKKVSLRYFINTYGKTVYGSEEPKDGDDKDNPYKIYSQIINGHNDAISYADSVGVRNYSVKDEYSTFYTNYPVNPVTGGSHVGLIDNGTEYIIPHEFKNSNQLIKVDSNSKLAAAGTSGEIGVRPIIQLVSGVIITGGRGTEDDPYRIEVSNEELSEKGIPGDYVKYGIDYTNVTVDGFRSDGYGWRILSNDNDQIKLISSGAPFKLSTQGKTTTQILSMLTTDFKNTEFITNDGTAMGSSMLNIFAEDVSVFNYRELSRCLNNSDDYVSTVRQIFYPYGNTVADRLNEYYVIVNPWYTNWTNRKAGLINIGMNYALANALNNNGTLRPLTVNRNKYLIDDGTSSELAFRVVVTLKKGIEIIGGNGLKDDPYILKDINELVYSPTNPEVWKNSRIKDGDYITYQGALDYNSFTLTIPENSTPATKTYKGWRVLPKKDGVNEVRIISAGTPYMWSLSPLGLSDLQKDYYSRNEMAFRIWSNLVRNFSFFESSDTINNNIDVIIGRLNEQYGVNLDAEEVKGIRLAFLRVGRVYALGNTTITKNPFADQIGHQISKVEIMSSEEAKEMIEKYNNGTVDRDTQSLYKNETSYWVAGYTDPTGDKSRLSLDYCYGDGSQNQGNYIQGYMQYRNLWELDNFRTGLRPILTLNMNSNIYIKSGTGTEDDPYVLDFE